MDFFSLGIHLRLNQKSGKHVFRNISTVVCFTNGNRTNFPKYFEKINTINTLIAIGFVLFVCLFFACLFVWIFWQELKFWFP